MTIKEYDLGRYKEVVRCSVYHTHPINSTRRASDIRASIYATVIKGPCLLAQRLNVDFSLSCKFFLALFGLTRAPGVSRKSAEVN